jgi:hypothetical protein
VQISVPPAFVTHNPLSAFSMRPNRAAEAMVTRAEIVSGTSRPSAIPNSGAPVPIFTCKIDRLHRS